MPVKLLKDVEFNNWALEYDVTDAALCAAAKEIEAGLVDARLGGYLIKKRVASAGRGKRGGFRTILGHRQADRLFFLHGFAKNDKDNITKAERNALNKLCDVYMLADDDRLAQMIEKSLLIEVLCHESHS